MDAKPLPARPNLEQFKKQAKDLVKESRAQDPDKKFTLADAQFALARAHGFPSWPKFSSHILALTGARTPTSDFEAAVDAIVSGDPATLRNLLKENPRLIRARSERVHRATLLHYVSANGVEDYRQKTPPNAVEIAQILLDAGADVNAFADMYGGNSTTLMLTATSIHPAKAGVAIPLMETLMAAGAKVDGGGGSDIDACLANGRPESAFFLVEKGARLDLEGACGVGKLEGVRDYFGPDGKLIAGATEEQLKSGFMWACEYGHNAVVEFLLDQGFDPGTLHRGMTGMHWAVVGARISTLELLIARGAPLEAKNAYDGTVLGCALWAVDNSDPVYNWPEEKPDWAKLLRTLIAAGARQDDYPEMKDELAHAFRHLENRP